MNCYLSTNSLLEAIGFRSCYIKKPELRNWIKRSRQLLDTPFFLDPFMFHRPYSNCRPQNSARYNHIICQTVENTSILERLSCILHAFARGYQGYKSNSDFKFLSTVRSGKSWIKNRFWIRRKEDTLNLLNPRV